MKLDCPEIQYIIQSVSGGLIYSRSVAKFLFVFYFLYEFVTINFLLECGWLFTTLSRILCFKKITT